MKQATEKELLELLIKAFDIGFNMALDDHRESDPFHKELRELKLQELIDSL